MWKERFDCCNDKNGGDSYIIGINVEKQLIYVCQEKSMYLYSHMVLDT